MDGDGSEESGDDTEETMYESSKEVDSPESAKRFTTCQKLQRTTDDTHAFGIETHFRREVIKWILHVRISISHFPMFVQLHILKLFFFYTDFTSCSQRSISRLVGLQPSYLICMTSFRPISIRCIAAYTFIRYLLRALRRT